MSNKTNIGQQGTDGSKTTHKGESRQSHQQPHPESNSSSGRHRRDASGNDAKHEENTTKKGANSI